MKAAIIAGCVVLSVSFGASGAHAGAYPKPIRPHLIYFNYLPPPEYDKPFTGKLLIRRFETEEEIVEVCKGSSKVACAARSVDGSTCHLFIAGDRVIKSHHTTWLFVLRHELGHCNGWTKAHERPRKVEMVDIKTVTLPKDKEILPIHPPVVCVTPDWKQEPCKNRNVLPPSIINVEAPARDVCIDYNKEECELLKRRAIQILKTIPVVPQ